MVEANHVEKELSATEEKVINDFSMTIATKNGSGSQTSNITILRALFRMGIPVTGKNLFPSNIQGLPTWFTIRASSKGYAARRETHEIVVAMNQVTVTEDYGKVVPGGVFVYADDLHFANDRKDIHAYPVPAKDLAKKSGAPAKFRDYVANMAYVGVLVYLLGIDIEKIKLALDFQFKGKESPINLNMGVIEGAIEWAKENLVKTDPYSVEEMDGTSEYVLSNGNTAGALGSIFGGVQFLSWYPITPATSLPEEVIDYLPILRGSAEGDGNNYGVIQSEDELAAIGMAIGAGWSGLRSMTSTSGPGISLMTEFVGYAYFAEIPVVIWDVVRVGPSTGLPTRTSQGDLTMTYFLGHGDTQQIILLPSSPYECFEFGWKSFDIAERVQTPLFVLSDLDLGMNTWMTKPFDYPNADMDRGKVLWEEDLDKIKGEWGRYKDVDGDGIPYRTIPGNKHVKGAYFVRGTGHDENANYSENSDVWEKNMARLLLKFETAKQYTPKPILIESKKPATIGILAYGTTEPAIIEAQDRLAEENIHADFLRIRSLPLHDEVAEFINKFEMVYVIELNRDGQMHQILKIELPELTSKLCSLPKHDGMPLSARWVTKSIVKKEQK
jgi:2-oxoglutarate/2-oxoacid ferredoxin oxidoreductase subunit alpha